MRGPSGRAAGGGTLIPRDDPHGERTVPELHIPDALHGEWLTLGPAEDDPRAV